MKKPIIIIGIGEIGGVFARGFLRLGHPVYPVTRDLEIAAVAEQMSDPEAVLVAVGENDLATTIESIPTHWQNRVCLLQNELLPKDWAQLPHQPTVISIWFEKKPGMDAKVIIPSPAFGPKAQLLAAALNAVDIPARTLESSEQLLFELVVKNLYILTSNIAGLKVGGTVGELWKNHQQFASDVAKEIVTLQEALSNSKLESRPLIDAMLNAFDGDPEHKCMGRSAPARLARALEHAEQFNLDLSMLKTISNSLER